MKTIVQSFQFLKFFINWTFFGKYIHKKNLYFVNNLIYKMNNPMKVLIFFKEFKYEHILFKYMNQLIFFLLNMNVDEFNF